MWLLTLVVTQVATAMLRAAKAEARSAPEREKFISRVLQGGRGVRVVREMGEREG